MFMKRTLIITLTCLAFMSSFDARAAEEVKVAPASGARSDREISIPYGFYNDSFGAAVGYVYSIVGSPQPQSAFMATAMAGTKGSAMLFLMGRDIRVFGVERLFMDPIVSTGYFVDNNAFINGNPSFSGQQAGSNGSDKNNFVTGSERLPVAAIQRQGRHVLRGGISSDSRMEPLQQLALASAIRWDSMGSAGSLC
jgi:hypothetical protein